LISIGLPAGSGWLACESKLFYRQAMIDKNLWQKQEIFYPNLT
jgi:hypothetical protein